MNPAAPPIFYNQADFNQRFIGDRPHTGVANANGSGLHPLSSWFGVPVDQEVFARDDNWNDHYQLPHALKGKNTYLREVVTGLVRERASWLNSEPDGLPIAQASSPTITWDEWKYSDGLMDLEPEEGVARLVESSYESNRAVMSRKGKAVLWEHGFLFSEKGQIQYVRQIQQITNHINKELELDAAMAMLNTRVKDIQWIAAHDPKFTLPYDQIIARKMIDFAAWQKRERAPEMMIDERKEMFSTRGITPGFIALAHSGEYYLRGVGPEKTRYDSAGAAGPARLLQNPFENNNSFRGLRVHYTPKFTGFKTGQLAMDPFIRDRIVGEYYRAFGPPLSAIDVETYKTEQLAIEVMDFGQNDWARLSADDAIECMFIFDGSGDDAFVMGTAPGDRHEFGPPNKDGHVDVLFGKWGVNGWGPCKFFGEIYRKQLPMDVIEFMMKQIVTKQYEMIFSAFTPFAGADMDAVFNKLAQVFTPQLNLYEQMTNAQTAQPYNPATGFYGQPTDIPSSAVASAGIPPNTGPDLVPRLGGYGAEMHSRKRGRDDAMGGIAYGSLVTPRTVVRETQQAQPLNVDAIHQENVSILASIPEIQADKASLYTQLYNTPSVNKQGLVLKSNEILKGQNFQQIAAELITPLEKFQNATTKKAADALLLTLTTPAVNIAASVATVRHSETVMDVGLPAFYRLEDIDIENFHPVDPLTGQSASAPETVALDTGLGAFKYLHGLTLKEQDIHPQISADVSAIRQRLPIGQSQTFTQFDFANVRNTAISLDDLKTRELDFRIAYLYRKYLLATRQGKNIGVPPRRDAPSINPADKEAAFMDVLDSAGVTAANIATVTASIVAGRITTAQEVVNAVAAVGQTITAAQGDQAFRAFTYPYFTTNTPRAFGTVPDTLNQFTYAAGRRGRIPFTTGTAAAAITPTDAESFNIKMFLVGCMLCFSYLTKSFLKALLQYDIYFPFNILWMRPWISVQTVTAIMGKGGSGAGYTFINDPDFMLGDDPISKMHHGHYTMRTKAVVLEPLNFTIMDDLWIKRYLAGGTTILFTANAIRQQANNFWTPPQNPNRHAMYAVLLPITQDRVGMHIDITGYFTGMDRETEQPHFITCHNMVSDLLSQTIKEDTHPYDPRLAKDYNRIVNQATQRCYSQRTKGWDAMILGVEAPFGVNVYPGMRSVMDGQDDIFRPQEYEKMEKYHCYSH